MGKTYHLYVRIRIMFRYIWLYGIFSGVIAVVILLFLYYIFNTEFEQKQWLSASQESNKGDEKAFFFPAEKMTCKWHFDDV